MLGDLGEKSSIEIYVVTNNSLEDKKFDYYISDLLTDLKLGEKLGEVSLFLITLEENTCRIEAGKNLADIISSDTLKEILDEYAIPELNIGEFGSGIYNALNEIVKIIESGMTGSLKDNTDLRFEGDISFIPLSPSSADEVLILASTTGSGEAGVTLRTSVNSAPDGSTNGEWVIIKELVVNEFNENNAPRWNTSDWSNGTYRVRVEARELYDLSWQRAVFIESNYTLENKEVSSTTQLETVENYIVSECDAYVDLGNEKDEVNHNLIGWSGIWSNQPKSPSDDTTFRYQFIRGEASLQLCIPQTGIDYNLITEVQDFGCDDSFDIYINDIGPVYSFKGSQSDTIIVHRVRIPSAYINSSIVNISFKNTATDECGAAAIYNVELKMVNG